MGYHRETRHTDDGFEISPNHDVTRDKSAYEKSKDAALKKSPDHKKMQWVHVPEIKEGTYIICGMDCNESDIREAYLRKRGLLRNLEEEG